MPKYGHTVHYNHNPEECPLCWPHKKHDGTCPDCRTQPLGCPPITLEELLEPYHLEEEFE